MFDLDDTLYLEADYVRSGFEAVGAWAANALGIAGYAERACRLFENGSRQQIFQTVLAELGHDPEPTVIDRMIDIYRRHQPRISLLPDAADCLRRLRPLARLGLISDGALISQRAKCESLRIKEVFDVVVLTGQWGAEFYKPHPRAYEWLQTTMATNASFVYVGDNPLKDFQAAIALGWHAIRVRRPAGLYSSREAPSDAVPAWEIADLWTLPERLSERFGFIQRASSSYVDALVDISQSTQTGHQE